LLGVADGLREAASPDRNLVIEGSDLPDGRGKPRRWECGGAALGSEGSRAKAPRWRGVGTERNGIVDQGGDVLHEEVKWVGASFGEVNHDLGDFHGCGGDPLVAFPLTVGGVGLAAHGDLLD
jgi:hypothetical protein